jgi:DNA polymerase III subunit delta
MTVVDNAMTLLKSAEIDRFVAKPDPARPIVLLFGPDAGAVSERADAIVRASVDDISDPFALVRLEGEELIADPARLIDEVQTVPLFGGRRAVRVRAGARNIATALEPLLAIKLVDCRVVIEAGDLKRNAPLRSLCERAPSVAALPCYADGERDLARLIDEEMRAAGLAISPEARAALIPLLGGDRRASRNELRKLAAYAHGEAGVDIADVVAVVADASALALDEVIDAALTGRTKDLDVQLGKALAAGTSPGTVVFAAQRQIANLHKARLAVEAGTGVTEQVEAMRVHFSRKGAVEAALKSWTSAKLSRAMQEVAAAQLETRLKPALADAVTRRALQQLALAARRKD